MGKEETGKWNGYTSYDIADLVAPKQAPMAREPKTAYLVVWFIYREDEPKRTYDVRIYGEPNPTSPPAPTTPLQRWESGVLARASGESYEEATARIHEAVEKHPHLQWIKSATHLSYHHDKRADVKPTP